MNTEKLYYWLNGVIETMETERPSEQQWKQIKEHVALVGNKQTSQIMFNNLTLTC